MDNDRCIFHFPDITPLTQTNYNSHFEQNEESNWFKMSNDFSAAFCGDDSVHTFRNQFDNICEHFYSKADSCASFISEEDHESSQYMELQEDNILHHSEQHIESREEPVESSKNEEKDTLSVTAQTNRIENYINQCTEKHDTQPLLVTYKSTDEHPVDTQNQASLDKGMLHSERNSVEESIKTRHSAVPSIEDELNSILKPKKNAQLDLACRRDVVNKTILRGFKKFFATLFNAGVKRSRSRTKSAEVVKKALHDKALSLGLIEEGEADQGLVEFVCWMGIMKNMPN